MSEPRQLPSEDEVKAFTAKLQDFRGTLSHTDQHMFDAMVEAAFKVEDAGDVRGYQRDALRPTLAGWYSTPINLGTPWAVTYASPMIDPPVGTGDGNRWPNAL